MTRKTNKLPSAINIEGENVRTDSSKFLESLSKYFANIGQTMPKNLPSSTPTFFKIQSKSYMQSFVMDEISAQDVSNSIDNIKPHSAPGVDGISPKYIKLTKPILSSYLRWPSGLERLSLEL